MTQPAKVQEPSMEEILASIRRIIADDEAKPATDVSAIAPIDTATAGSGRMVASSGQARSDMDMMKTNEAAAKPAATAKPEPQQATAPAAPQPVVPGRLEMDEMLAGIEKMIATPPPAAPAANESDIFQLTDEMALPAAAPATFRTVEAKNDIEFADGSAAAKAEAPRRPAPPPAPNAADILSSSTVSAVETAFNSLAATVLSNNARTLEDLVKEMMRPMLKNWLDDNLPGLVERIVKAEIERVSRGR